MIANEVKIANDVDYC